MRGLSNKSRKRMPSLFAVHASTHPEGLFVEAAVPSASCSEVDNGGERRCGGLAATILMQRPSHQRLQDDYSGRDSSAPSHR